MTTPTSPTFGASNSVPSFPHRAASARFIEAALLLCVLLVLLSGSLLVLWAKQANLPTGPTLNINTATGADFARVLNIPAPSAARLVETRKARGGFDDVDALGRIPLVPNRRAQAAKAQAAIGTPAQATTANLQKTLGTNGAEAARLIAVRNDRPKLPWEKLLGVSLVPPSRLSTAAPGLVARAWSDVLRTFWIHVGMLAAFLVVAHLLLRWAHPRADPFLLPIAAFLSVLGVLLLFAIKDPLRDIPTYASQAQGVVFGGGLALLFALSPLVHRAPLHRYGYVYALASVLGTVLLGIAGSGPGGVHLSVAGVQPVEVIKVLIVLFLAGYLAERSLVLNDATRKGIWAHLPHRHDALPLLVLFALPLVLFALVRDLGPVLLLFGTFLCLAYLATGRGLPVMLGLCVLLVAGCIGYKLKIGVFETRVAMWLSPWDNTQKSGDHLALGWWGLASGGPWGSGLGLGGSRFTPRAGSDLAFAALGEEAGIWATASVLFCFLVLAGRGLAIARRAASDFDRLAIAGLCTLLALQTLIISGGTLGLLPLAGITLPFVSNGKSSVVASWLIVGLLLSLSARIPQSGAALPPPPGFVPASRRLGMFFVLLLGFVPLLRLVYLQEIAADVLASRPVRVPDADGVKRPHLNPRLLSLSERIERGKLLDRNGEVLAETKNRKRVYPYGPYTAHLVGYADPAVGGPVGLEDTLSPQMRGFDGWAGLVGLWRRKDFPGFRLPKGEDVRLTIDAEWQKRAQEALVRGAARAGKGKNRGAVVVLDAQTGVVLVAATSPTFDPNTLTPKTLQALNAKRANFPLLDRAQNGYYPPGSTFKIVSATALLANGKADFTRTCNKVDYNVVWKANGQTFARRRVRDDEGDRPHGTIGLSDAVSESCNIYFARAALALGPDTLRQTATQFDFARLPSPDIFARDLADLGYGQGAMLASPLEMAGVAQTVASGGVHRKPTFLLDDAPQETAHPLTSENAARLAQMMLAVTRTGTAHGRFDDLPYSVAGKTGTAENTQYDRASHSWFIGFAPANKPQYAFAVLVENGGYGASVAAPIAHEVLQNAPALHEVAK